MHHIAAEAIRETMGGEQNELEDGVRKRVFSPKDMAPVLRPEWLAKMRLLFSGWVDKAYSMLEKVAESKPVSSL